ncbi:hypothetical protein LJC04_06770 [Ruminococcaceae bacterium OttesenSCG-928-O06]|nr:hypothetical protein [Ruminococcaceae bacterium OttesenSCG-928-O06]
MKTKQLCALLLVAVMAFALTGCIGNLYENALTIDGTEISSGLYLMAQFTAYNEARSKVEDAEKDVLKQKIDGQSATAWIRERAEELCLKYVAVQRLCREKGITLSYEGQQSIEQMMQYWTYLEELYTENGISEGTLRRYATNEELSSQLFMALYGKDGELASPDSEMMAEYAESHAHIRYLIIPTTPLEGDADVSGDVNAAVQDLLLLLQGGKTLEEVAVEDLPWVYDLMGRTYDVETAADSVTDSYIGYEQDNYETYTEEFLQELKAQSVGDYGLYAYSTTLLLYQKVTPFADAEEFDAMRGTVVSALKTDAYEEYLRSVYEAYPVNWVFGSRTYLSPGKIEY